ncbi:MAG: heparinase II/III family protein [Rhodospirillales bacterium]|nr:heparinase II/III family protein [Rhodospirillales bacterium]
MSLDAFPSWFRRQRRLLARVRRLPIRRVPEAPALPVRDPWPGDPVRGARLLQGELEVAGSVIALAPGRWDQAAAPGPLAPVAHGFTWLRDLRALGTDAARLRARALVGEWIADTKVDDIARRPDVMGARITAWLGHYDFFAASADDGFRHKLMGRLVADAYDLSAALPPEELDERALTALKGLIAAAVALPDYTAFLTRALRFLPQEIARQVLPDGCHVERSPAAHLAALQDLTEIRALLQASQTTPPPALGSAILRMAAALRMLRHGDGGLALFNGSKEEQPALIEAVLAQAGRTGRGAVKMDNGRFVRLQAGRSVLMVDAGPPPAPGLDRYAHAGTLSLEMSVGRERLIVNCGAMPGAGQQWQDAARATAAHSTLVMADLSSAELKPHGLGRRPRQVEARLQTLSGGSSLEASHDGWQVPLGAIHHRRIVIADSGEEIYGEDAVMAAQPQPFVVRFHLHPAVTASLLQDGDGVLLRLPSGAGWQLRTDAAQIVLEESIYLGGTEPRRAEQVVLSGFVDGPQQVKWTLNKVG